VFRQLLGLSRREAREQGRVVRIQEATDRGWWGVLAYDRKVVELRGVPCPGEPDLETQTLRVCQAVVRFPWLSLGTTAERNMGAFRRPGGHPRTSPELERLPCAIAGDSNVEASGQQKGSKRSKSSLSNRAEVSPKSSQARMNRAIARRSSPTVVSVEQACHAGGRGFESRRSRLQTSLHMRMFRCLLRRVRAIGGQQTGSTFGSGNRSCSWRSTCKLASSVVSLAKAGSNWL
jgi:hypothetical protein